MVAALGWILLEGLVDLLHFCVQFTDLGVQVTFHHQVGEVNWGWSHLGDFLTFGGDLVIEFGGMLPLLV